MSVEEIRAQRRDLVEPQEEDQEDDSVVQTAELLLNEDGSVQVEALLVEDDAETVKGMATSETTEDTASTTSTEKTRSDEVPNPPAGSLADLTISPPGSPVPTSPIIAMDPNSRLQSPAPSTSSGTGSRQPQTQSRSNEAYLQTVLRRRASNSADDFAEKMRTAAVMLAQLNQQQAAQLTPGANNTSRSSAQSRSAIKAKATSVEDIRAKIIKEMMALEEQRMQRMKVEGVSSGVGGGGGEGAGSEMLEDERKVMANVTTDDPSGMFSTLWIRGSGCCLFVFQFPDPIFFYYCSCRLF